jgi:hypothetical protein
VKQAPVWWVNKVSFIQRPSSEDRKPDENQNTFRIIDGIVDGFDNGVPGNGTGSPG